MKTWLIFLLFIICFGMAEQISKLEDKIAELEMGQKDNLIILQQLVRDSQ